MRRLLFVLFVFGLTLSATAADPIQAQLEKLETLKSKGIITEAEYKEARMKLILKQAEESSVPPPLPEPTKVPKKPSVKQSAPPPQAQADWTSPAWRSAIVPGWGQHYNGQGTKGTILGVATIGLFAGGWATFFMSESAANSYMSLGPSLAQGEYDQKYSDWENTANLNHGIVIAFGIAYAWTLVDAISNANTRPSNVSFEVTPEHIKATVALATF